MTTNIFSSYNSTATDGRETLGTSADGFDGTSELIEDGYEDAYTWGYTAEDMRRWELEAREELDGYYPYSDKSDETSSDWSDGNIPGAQSLPRNGITTL